MARAESALDERLDHVEQHGQDSVAIEGGDAIALRQRPFVFVNDTRLEFAGDDPTEDAVRGSRHSYDPTVALIAKKIITGMGQRPVA